MSVNLLFFKETLRMLRSTNIQHTVLYMALVSLVTLVYSYRLNTQYAFA